MSTDKQEGMTIEQGNKLIAEFMGAEEIMDQIKTTSLGPLHKIHTGKMHFKDRSPDLMYVCKIIDLRYHSSWDWLMPVCKKLDYLVENKVVEHSPEYEFFNDRMDDAITRRYEITPVWNAVIDFIEWYNNQTK